MKPIVQQSAYLSYSPFPALPAPHIAGLLPATVPSGDHRNHTTFNYTHSHLATLPSEQRDRLFVATRTLLDVALAYTSDTMNIHALDTALALFRRAVTGQGKRATSPAEFNAEMDVVLLEWAAQRAHRGGRHE